MKTVCESHARKFVEEDMSRYAETGPQEELIKVVLLEMILQLFQLILFQLCNKLLLEKDQFYKYLEVIIQLMMEVELEISFILLT